MRCAEVLTGIMYDPVRVDPHYAAAHDTIMRARRMLRKGPWRQDHLCGIYHQIQKGTQPSNRIPGPACGLLKTVIDIGATINPNSGRVVICFRGGIDVPLDTHSGTFLSEMVRESIRYQIVEALQSRTLGDGGRKDVQGIQPHVDRRATLRSLRGVRTNPEVSGDAASRRQMQCIIAGAIRPPNRLAAAGLIKSAHCPHCKATKCDAAHLFWQCPHFDTERKRYIDEIEGHICKVQKRSKLKADRLRGLLQTPCFRHCGIVNGTAELSKALAELTADDELHQAVMPGDIHYGQPDDAQDAWQTDADGVRRAVVYTDGSAINAETILTARAGWGVWYGQSCVHNQSRCLQGHTQTSFRAELRAVAHVLRHAGVPTCLVVDCKPVVQGVQQILDGHWQQLDKRPEEDLWAIICDLIEHSPQGYFKVTWVPSHLDDEGRKGKREYYLADGTVTLADIHGNAMADKLANNGRDRHVSVNDLVRDSNDRATIANTAHSMMLRIWKLHSATKCANTGEDHHSDQSLNADLAQLDADAELFQQAMCQPVDVDMDDYAPFGLMDFDGNSCDEQGATLVPGDNCNGTAESQHGTITGTRSAPGVSRGTEELPIACQESGAAHGDLGAQGSSAVDDERTSDATHNGAEGACALGHRAKYPTYCWDMSAGDADDTLQVKVARHDDPRKYGRASLQYIDNKGESKQFAVPYDAWAPVAQWASQLSWTTLRDGSSRGRTVSWIELAIAFTRWSGISLGKGLLDLCAQAALMRIMLRRIMVQGRIQTGKRTTTYHAAMGPSTSVDSCKALLGFLTGGLSRRPVLGRDDTEAIAEVIIKHRGRTIEMSQRELGRGWHTPSEWIRHATWEPSSIQAFYAAYADHVDNRIAARQHKRSATDNCAESVSAKLMTTFAGSADVADHPQQTRAEAGHHVNGSSADGDANVVTQTYAFGVQPLVQHTPTRDTTTAARHRARPSGPCHFGHPHSGSYDRGAERWFWLPLVNSWHGLDDSTVLCQRCYLAAIDECKRGVRRHVNENGDLVMLYGAVRATDAPT